MFLDRLNKLLQKCGLDPAVSGKIHEAIDTLDALSSFDTKGGFRKDTLGWTNPVNPVGERLRLHELHMLNSRDSYPKPPKFFFWTGGELVAKSP